MRQRCLRRSPKREISPVKKLNPGTSLSLRRHDPDQVQRVTAVSHLRTELSVRYLSSSSELPSERPQCKPMRRRVNVGKRERRCISGSNAPGTPPGLNSPAAPCPPNE